jgi:hypothetical protein
MGHRIKSIDNFVDLDDAKKIIRMVESDYRLGDLEGLPENPMVGVISNENLESEALIRKYSDKLIKLHQEEFGIVVDLYTVQGHNCIWERLSEASLHVDSHKGSEHIITSSVLYLGGTFIGGDLEFPHQGFSYPPKALSALIYPSGGLEYPHKQTMIKSGSMYTMSLWHSHEKKFSLAEKYLNSGKKDLYEIWK